jgi:TetR/AcrR family transcriptional regulator, cholesterol catabolism regulator
VPTERAARRTRETGPVSAELIEQEAVRLFSERTYPVIGMRDIGDAVGLLPGSLYVHISSKEDLLLRIVERGIQNYLDEIGAVANTEDPAADRLRAAIVAHFRVLAGSLDQTRVAFHQWTYLGADKHPAVIAMRQRFEDLFTDIVRDGVTSGEFRPVRNLRVTVLAIIGMLNSAPGWYSPGGTLSPEEVGAEIADVALSGMVAR